jgi:DegV family protein with EDD domain
VDDLTYLYRGGRVSGVSKVVGNLLGIKPILYFNEEGKILNINKVKGFKKALATLIDYMKNKGSELDKYKVYILQADCPQEAEAFAASIKAQFGNLDVEIQPVGPVIGAHCGPGTIGLVFHAKEK